MNRINQLYNLSINELNTKFKIYQKRNTSKDLRLSLEIIIYKRYILIVKFSLRIILEFPISFFFILLFL